MFLTESTESTEPAATLSAPDIQIIWDCGWKGVVRQRDSEGRSLCSLCSLREKLRSRHTHYFWYFQFRDFPSAIHSIACFTRAARVSSRFASPIHSLYSR